ncbi:MAG TPA: FMN reductase, partial [Paraburkholderia sp.]|nr:FMN reductase [Paraburkholderia sp.]
VHALRGWPTPFGAGINTLETRFDTADTCSDPKVVDQLSTVGQQAAQFALAFRSHHASGAAAHAASNETGDARGSRVLALAT